MSGEGAGLGDRFGGSIVGGLGLLGLPHLDAGLLSRPSSTGEDFFRGIASAPNGGHAGGVAEEIVSLPFGEALGAVPGGDALLWPESVELRAGAVAGEDDKRDEAVTPLVVGTICLDDPCCLNGDRGPCALPEDCSRGASTRMVTESPPLEVGKDSASS